MNEHQLHELIRQSFDGRNRKRLAFTLKEVSHAWVNVFVERLKSRINEKWAYVLGHVAAWIGAIVVFAAIGSVSVVLLGAIV